VYAVEILIGKVYHHSSDKAFHSADAFVMRKYVRLNKVEDHAGSFSVPSMVMLVHVHVHNILIDLLHRQYIQGVQK